MNLITDEPGKDVAQNNNVKLWYHHDHLGSTDYLMDNVDGKVVSYVTYDDWGAPTAKANLKMGVRELDLVVEYTGHPYDQVIGLFFAEARMYDAADRRFVSVDPVKGFMRSTQSLNQYLYVLDNPLKYVDLRGLYYIKQIYIKNADPVPGPGSEGITQPDNGVYEYLAVKQGTIGDILKAAVHTLDPSGGFLSGMIILPAQAALGYVGGNSFEDVSLLDIQISFIEEIAQAGFEDFADDAMSNLFGTSVPFISVLSGVYSSMDSITSGQTVKRYDEIIFTLLDLCYTEFRSVNIETVISRMNNVYRFVAKNSVYFFGSMTVTIREINFFGNIRYETIVQPSVNNFISNSNQRVMDIIRAFRMAVFGTDHVSPR